MTKDARRLARDIERLRKADRDKGSTPQLGTSSMHDDGSIPAYDIDGTLKQVIGYQPDGTTTTTDMNGPTPPRPSTPIVEALPAAGRVFWDGNWTDGAVAPLDLARIDVHITAAAADDPMLVAASATIAAQGWGEASIPLPAGEHYAHLVARTTSGKWSVSDPSAAIVIDELASTEPYVPPAPDASPDVQTLGGLKQVFVRWDALVGPGPFLYELHVSTAPFTPTAGDPATFVMETASTLVSVKSLPDLTPFSYDVDYYFRLIAKTAGGAAEPGGGALGRMDRAAQGDLAANSVTAETLSSIFTFSQLFRTAASGQRGEWDSDSLRFYDSAGNQGTRLSGADSFLAGLASLARLETASATLGGETTGPPGGAFKVGAQIMQAPVLPLDHISDTIAKLPLPSPAGPVFTDSAAAKGWRIAQRSDGAVALERLSLATGDVEAATPLFRSDSPIPLIPAAMSTDRFYVYDGVKIRAIARPTSTSFSVADPALATMPAAPGTGGYGSDVPIIGVQRGTGHLLIAHRVQGAQTIGGQDYLDREVMVRRFAPSVSGAALTLTLVQTIRTGGYASGQLASVLMENVSGSFDVPAVSGSTAMVVSCFTGFTPFDQNHFVYMVPNAGANVSSSWSGGAFTWYGQNTGLFWDGTAFWGTTKAGDAIEKFSSSSTIAVPVFHAYTFWNGTQETELSPVVDKAILARRVSRWTIPALPVGVTQVRLYVAAADSRVRYERVGTFTGTPGQPLTIVQNPISPPAGDATSPPPAMSTFVGASSYRIYDGFENEWSGAGAVTVRDPLMPTDAANKRYVDSLDIPVAASISYATDWSDLNASETTEVEKVGKLVVIYIGLKKGSANTAGQVVGTIPVGFRPRRTTRVTGNNAGSIRSFTISTSGVITADVAQTTGTLAAAIGSATYFTA